MCVHVLNKVQEDLEFAISLQEFDYDCHLMDTERGSPLRIPEKGNQDYVLREMFRGDVFVAPKTLVSPTILPKFVFNVPGAIGYLRTRDVDESVKVICIDGLRPEDKGYLFQFDEPTTAKEPE